MSMEALLDAVAARIISACGYTTATCGVQMDGRPPPIAGQVYVSVHPGEVVPLDREAHRLDEEYEVGVTITMRVAYLPPDRRGASVVRYASTGLYARAEAIRAACHMNEALRVAANVIIGAGENGFVEPLKSLGIGRPMRQAADWFAADAEGDGDDGPAFSIEARLGGARRVQVIEEQS